MRAKSVSLAFALALSLTGSAALAQSYPNRPIKVIVPYPAGGVLDTLTRAVAEHARTALGQPWVIENRMGAAGALGLQACATAEPDGYTFCPITAEALAVAPHVSPKLYERYKMLTPVTQFVTAPGVVYAHPSLQAGNLREVVAHARANPTALQYSSWGHGTSPHLFFEWLKKSNGVEILHVPHKGSAEAVSEVVAGRLQLSYVAVGFVMPQIEAGKLKPLAVIGDERTSLLPDTPSLGELGIPFPYKGAWFGLMAPEGTPLPLRERVAAVVKDALGNADLRKRFLDPQGYKPVGSTPQDFAAFITAEQQNGAEVMRVSGIQPE